MTLFNLMDTLHIGSIITTHQERDAVHMAIAPVVAHDNLRPGGAVALRDGEAIAKEKWTIERAIGIVDPFLESNVLAGQKFWLFLYPGSITSLRHDWTHPAFPILETVTRFATESEKWISDFACRCQLDYEHLMRAADEFVSIGEWYCFGDDDYPDPSDEEWQEFWRNYEIVKAKAVPKRSKTGFFRCAC